jgi:hypothetical protein
LSFWKETVTLEGCIKTVSFAVVADGLFGLVIEDDKKNNY